MASVTGAPRPPPHHARSRVVADQIKLTLGEPTLAEGVLPPKARTYFEMHAVPR